MKYKNLGKTDIKVSLIGLGTMTWGQQNDKHEAFEQMSYALVVVLIFLMWLKCIRFHPCMRHRVIRSVLLVTRSLKLARGPKLC